MRRSVLILAVMAAVVLGAPAIAAADTLVGVLVDSSCFATGGLKSMLPAHAACAIACAQKGHRLALVTATGVYRVTGALTQGNNAQLIPLVMNGLVVLTGTAGVRVVQSAVPVVAAPGDGRRPTGSLDGLINKTVVRTGDFREGDVPVPGTVEMVIDAISAVKYVILGL
jgi:hypothetical protein